MEFNHPRILFLVIACITMSAGCGGEKLANVTGQALTQDGSPLVGAKLIARAESGDWASSTTDGEGRFVLTTKDAGPGVQAGSYQVTIVEQQTDWDHPEKPTISSKYRSKGSSGLTFEVEAGEDRTLQWNLDPP